MMNDALESESICYDESKSKPISCLVNCRGHMKKGWSFSDDSSHGATCNLMCCFHPLDTTSSSASSPFE